MPFLIALVLACCTALFAVEQEQPTPYDLIRPIWPMTWDTAATDQGGTVESFSSYAPFTKKRNTVPAVGSKPQDFKPNGLIPDTLNQAYRDAQNIRIGRIRVNQAGYLPEDDEKQFYYVSAGTCAEKFVIVDLEGNPVSEPAALTSTGKATTSSWSIRAGTDAATANQGRYRVDGQGPEGTVCIGHIADVGGLDTDTRYRIKILDQYSATFIISDKVYSMVRDATLKFYGINRSGNSESWFHKPSHTKDGGGKFVRDGAKATEVAGFTSVEGALQGGWYDCGDHLKESQTQAYAFMVLAVMAVANPDRDEDHYAYNMGETVNTDGIPDILREAKHGADFFLRAYRFADGVIDNMAVSVGNFGFDHSWWGRPENQDALPATLRGRGGPHERDVRLGELGSNISGQIAAGLALLSVNYATYDKAFADSCLMVAEELYDFAKNLALGKKSYGLAKYGKKTDQSYVYNTVPAGWATPAYNGNNEYHDDLAMAAWALHFATYQKTGDMSYLEDAVSNQEMVKNTGIGADKFSGGWMGSTSNGMLKSSKNTSWANAYTYALYGFYRILLRDTETAAKYGISEKDRLSYSEKILYTMAANISYLQKEGSNFIELPNPNTETPLKLSYTDLWFNMQTDQTWIYNRYQSGNIFEVLAYSEIAKDFEGVKLPVKGSQNWNSAAMKKLGMNQLNYMLGVNPWDISFLLGVGDKNDAHPHHRAANPEGRNMPGSSYKYNPPVGALFGGVTPDDINDMDPDTLSWANYHISETCIDGTAMFVASNTVAVREEDRNRAPEKVTVEIRYVGYDSAIVKITQDLRGPAMILYSTNEAGPFNKAFQDSISGVSHEIHMTGLQSGTTYYFKVAAVNIRSEAYTTKWLVDSTHTPYSFTTLISPPEDANIQNIKVCNLSADTAEIMWYTPNGQYESKVYWDTALVAKEQMMCPGTVNGNCDIVGNADVSGLPTSFHYVKIGTLKEKTTFYYCVESNGVSRCKDDKGQPLKFTTPVTQYKFAVHTYQYYEQGLEGMDRININLVNGEDRAFDSLELRFYVTAKPEEMEITPGENNGPGSCPLMVDEDICIAYDEAGFNKPCENDREIRDLLRGAPPIKLEDTYNPATGEYDYYIPVPLGSTTIKSSSRMRIDLAFSDGYYQQGKCDPLYRATKKRMNAETGDWTWRAHQRVIDGADYDGMPVWEKDDGDQEMAPVNPYVVVYRKGEFISGYSPSYQEMITKKANYEITMSYDAPFNVSNGSYVEIDSTISTMHVTGQAFITESGYVTDIWVNGVALTREQLAKAAIYDETTGRYKLDIPVKLTIGTNKVDITVFAGPDPNCLDCAENGGCAFINRSYYVQFSKGDRTSSSLLLFAANDEPLSSLALPNGSYKIDGTTKFRIELRDKDNRGNATMNAYIINSRTGDSTLVTLKRTDETLGYFSSDFLTAQAQDGLLPNIPFFGGDSITIRYVDPEDEDDVSSAKFWSDPTRPVPKFAYLKNDVCTITGSAIPKAGLSIKFTGNVFNGTTIVLDSILLKLEASSTTAAKEVMITPSAAVIGDSVYLQIADSLIGTADPMGKAVVYMREDGKSATEEVEITDRIRPKLVSVSILENENHENKQDTLKFVFSEPVDIPDTKTWPLSVYDKQTPVDVSGIVVISATTSDDGKSWQYVIEGNDSLQIKATETAQVSATIGVVDYSNNKIATCAPVTIIEAVRPVPVQYAKITDFTGDGQPDEIYVEFVRTLRDKDIPDTIDVYWGKPAVYQAFTAPASGWNLTSIEAGIISTVLTKLDSSRGNWIKGTAQQECVEFKDVEVIDKIITKWHYTYLDDDSTSAPIDSTVASADTSKHVESRCSKKVTKQDSTFVPAIDTLYNADGTPQTKDSVYYHSVIKIAVPNEVYKNQTYGADDGKGKIRPRVGPVENQITDITHALLDYCPPVILSAQWSGYDVGDEERGTLDDVLLTFSEPVDTVTHPYYVEREREGSAGVYYSPMNNPALSVAVVSPTSMRLSYMHKEKEALWIGDNVRLLSDTTFSAIKDKAGLYAGVDHPWVPINGTVTEVIFSIRSVEPVTKSRNNYDVYYGGSPFAPEENFRLTTKNKDGATVILAAGNNTLKRVNSAPIANYKSAGPVFEIEVSLPFGNSRDYQLNLDLDIFSNMGSYVINTHYSDSTSYLKNYLSAGSSLTLYLEWCAPEDFPVSASGKKIGTSPYIAKFKTKASSNEAPAEPEEGDDGRAISDSDTFTKTFGFRRVKQ